MNPGLGLIGLARRGGLIAMGEEPTGAMCRTFKAAAVFVASDAAENSCRRAKNFADIAGVPCLVAEATKEQLGNACGRSSLAMFALCDTGMALSVARKLCREDFEAIAALEEAESAEKALRKVRKKKK